MNRDRTMIRTWAALAGVALATACGGDSPTPTAPPTPPDPPRATTVAVNPATAELDVGETVQLAAVVRDQNSTRILRCRGGYTLLNALYLRGLY